VDGAAIAIISWVIHELTVRYRVFKADFPAPESKGEARGVTPGTFFDELPAVMIQVPPLPGEEALCNWVSSVLEAAAKDSGVKTALTETAIAAERGLDHAGACFKTGSHGRLG